MKLRKRLKPDEKKYTVKIDPEALNDIQEITNWYNDQQKALGGRFQKTTIQQINSLKKDPHIYSIRYDEIRCMSIKKFPYMAHFFINDINSTIVVLAVISTARNPKIWEEKTSKK